MSGVWSICWRRDDILEWTYVMESIVQYVSTAELNQAALAFFYQSNT